RPLVTLLPSCSCSLAPHCLIAWASVLAVMNSTPSTPALTMCATALPPPPPTPTTFITALGANFSISSKCAMSSSSVIRFQGFCCSYSLLALLARNDWVQNSPRYQFLNFVQRFAALPAASDGRRGCSVCAPHNNRPTPVACTGLPTTSPRPATCWGFPTRTGMCSISSAS